MEPNNPPGPGKLSLCRQIRPLLALSLLGVMACQQRDDAPVCDLPPVDALSTFARCDDGAGVFGRWFVDDQGLPAYRYELDQETDSRAQWRLSSGELRRDHRFQLGNDRLLAFATNQGFVELFSRDRGPVFWNRINLEAGRPGGGFSYIQAGPEAWATAQYWAPADGQVSREFGVGYARYVTRHRQLEVSHRITAPPGDWPFIIDQVTLTNHGDHSLSFWHYEVWDANRHPITMQLARSGTLAADIPAAGDAARRAESRLYRVAAVADATAEALRIRRTWDGTPSAAPDDYAARDYYPADFYVARLWPPTAELPAVWHSDRAAFIADGSPALPAAVRDGLTTAPLANGSNEGEPAILVEAVELTLGAGESQVLRYAIGYAPAADGLEVLDDHRRAADDQADAVAASWRERLPFVRIPRAPVLHREMAWHAAQLQAAAVYDEYFSAHTIAQGSVYMYGHGLDGAARDFALFSVPLAYLQPELAREQLRTVMRMTYAATRQISYAVQGLGKLETGGIHHAPSDLDLFFLWAVTEYVVATGDHGFLDDPNPYWPRDASALETTREHLVSQLRHLMDDVGLGEHGLIRLHTGDWSDGISFEASNRELAEADGESVPNTQMATWVLPRVAGLLADTHPSLAAEVEAWAVDRREAAIAQWNGQWYRRAWFGAGESFGDGHLNLESQIWALIADLPTATQRETLLSAIQTQLEDSSPVGARRVPGGDVWHAVTGLLTWGYVRHAPERAWAALERHTMAAYATHNPTQWYGIWSGPDALGVNGGTWTSEVTPMTDFPIFNANQHALPLLALIRVAGLEPTADGRGLRLAPAATPETVHLSLPLINLQFDTQHIEGRYRALTPCRTTLQVKVPAGASRVEVDGVPQALPASGEDLSIPLDLAVGESLSFFVGP